MSVLITDMSYPGKCEECLFYEVDCQNGCFLTKNFCFRRKDSDVPAWCPLSEIVAGETKDYIRGWNDALDFVINAEVEEE